MKAVKRQAKVSEDPQVALKRIAGKLRRLRKAKGYDNSDDFAYDHDINRSQYGKYEAGTQDMRVSSLVKIINAMGLTLEQFFADGLDR